MMLTLTIKEEERNAFDIQVPSTQRIKDTIQVLCENRLLKSNEGYSYRVFSIRKKQWLDIKQTYEGNGVYTADILGVTYEEEN